MKNEGNAVGIVTMLQGGQSTNRDLIPGIGKRYSFSAKCLDKLWGIPTSLLMNSESSFPPG